MAALEGIRVLDFSAMIAGPYCTRLMSDSGAEVIKLEPPAGDYMRSRAPMRGGASLYFGVLNAGKQSVALDIKHPQAKALVLELVATCDVVVENFRPGVMQRLGFGYDVFAKVNPGLVYTSISGYGQKGAHAGLPAYAPIVQAASGYDEALMQYQGVDRPPKSAIFIADYLTGVHAFGATCAALVRRARTGHGEAIDCALMDAMIGMLAYEVGEAQEPAAQPRAQYQPSRCRDGFIMVAPISPGNFEDMVRVVGRDDLRTDPRFATSGARATHWNTLMAEVERWTSERSVDECERAMRAGGVPCARYQSVADVLASPYAAERGLFETVKAGTATMQAPNPPFRMQGVRTAGGVPELGEHGGGLLRRLGKNDDEIARLHASGALAGPVPRI